MTELNDCVYTAGNMGIMTEHKNQVWYKLVLKWLSLYHDVSPREMLEQLITQGDHNLRQLMSYRENNLYPALMQ